MRQHNLKPIVLVCDNIAFLKMKDEIKEYMKSPGIAIPYKGSKLHYILDLEDDELLAKIMPIIEKLTPVPKSKKKKVA